MKNENVDKMQLNLHGGCIVLFVLHIYLTETIIHTSLNLFISYEPLHDN